MKVSVEHHDHYAVLSPRGDFQTLDCPVFIGEVQDLIDDGDLHVMLRLSLVKSINSAALGAIIKSHKLLKDQGGMLVLSRPSPICKTSIGSLGLETIIPTFDEEEEAIACLQKQEKPAAEKTDAHLSVLFTPLDAEICDQLSGLTHRGGAAQAASARKGRPWHGAARLDEIHQERLKFTWDGGTTGLDPKQMAELLRVGLEMRVKFALPFQDKTRHEAVVQVASCDESDAAVEVVAGFHQVSEGVSDLINQYVADIAYLREELESVREEKSQ